jgi:hypothetical protein
VRRTVAIHCVLMALSLRFARGLMLLAVLFFLSTEAFAREHWTELNVGPFFIDTPGDTSAARDDLAQLEQLRWVLGGLLEVQDLRSLWPIRIVFDNNAKTNPNEFVSQNGQFLLICRPDFHLPLDKVAALFLEANTPRLPDDADSSLQQLFSTLEAHGSHVSWGGPVAHPDLAWARMQLFATRFEYRLSLHILVTSLKNGSSLPVAERNAFGKDPAVLDKEAQANLNAGKWEPVAVSGRPLDPKRDFGEHSVDNAVVDTYRASAELATNPKEAEALYKAAIEAGGTAKALGFAGLAEVARLQNEDPKPFLQDAIDAGSSSAPVYVAAAAEGAPPKKATELLKLAASLNPKWAVPVYQQARLATDPAAKEALLRKAAQIDLRGTEYWIELAQLQTEDGHPIEAQGSWLRAEDSAPTQAERDHIHQLRLDTEQKRLDAADEERARNRDAAHQDDQRAQDNEAAAIRAAEEKANHALDQTAGSDKPETVVPWDSVVPKRKLTGVLTLVECLHGGRTRLTVKDRAGKSTLLLSDKTSTPSLACGAQQPPKHVSLSYAAEPDDQFRTAGRVLSIQLP